MAHSLSFDCSSPVAEKIQAKDGKHKIHFMRRDTEIHIGDEIVCEKTIDKLLSTSQGPAWLI